MAPKRAMFFCYGNDNICAETRKYIEDAGVILKVRDIGKDPLTENEVAQLVGHLEITHFINRLSDSYVKFRFDKKLPAREEIIRLMAKDHTLIRRPIVKTTRLLTVGCDQRKIADMLQINSNGQVSERELNTRGNRKIRLRQPASGK